MHGLDVSSFSVKTARAMFDEEFGVREFLTSGDGDLDFFVGGGIRFGAVTEISGEAGCGKSQLCMQMAARSLLDGRRVLYIDTEKGAAIKRIMQLVTLFQKTLGTKAETEEIAKNLMYAEPSGLQELLIQLEQSASNQVRADLLVLDSITSFFRGEELTGMVRDLDAVAVALCRLATSQKMAVLCTNHVTTKFHSDGNSHLEPSLGFYWSHRPTVRIWMKRAERRKFIEITRSPWTKHRLWEYAIKEEGIRLLNTECLRF